MTNRRRFKPGMFAVATILLLSAMTGLGHAAPGGSSSPCGTSGPLVLSEPNPNSYSYTQGDSGSQSVSISVTAPATQVTGNCDEQQKWFGSGSNKSETLTVEVEINGVTDSLGTPVDSDTEDAVIAAFGTSNPATLVYTVTGSTQTATFSFANSADIPPGSYLVKFRAGAGSVVPDGGEKSFSLAVNEAPDLPEDTLPPDVSVSSPTPNQAIVINSVLNLVFTATDPTENGAGTGVTDVDAALVTVASTAYEEPIALLTLPALPVAAGIPVTASGAITMAEVGSYTLTAYATDGAEHTGEFPVNFTVKVNMACLPPISVAGRQFNSGSTVPVKWAFTDVNGAFLPPYNSIKAVISGVSASATAYAGSEASSIRWELDGLGNAMQYIVNFPIPATLTANTTYTATISVQDVDGDDAVQGTCTFIASPAKGGKVK